MLLSYNVYYFIFVLLLTLVFVTLFNKAYIYYKNEEALINKSNFSNLFIYCFLLMFYFILFNLFNSSNYFLNLNIVFIYKLFLILFSFWFLFIFKFYCNINNFFSYECIWILTFAIFCLFILFESNNFLYFYIILEGYSLSIASFLALKKLNKKILNASFNYLIINIVTSCLILLSISFIYYLTGTTNLLDICNLSSVLFVKYKLLNIVYFGLFLCFFIKLSIFPFSFLILDIYSNFPYIFTLFFLTIPKLSFSLFVINNFIDLYTSFKSVLIFLIIITSILHSILATTNINSKSLFINTSFSNIIFIMCPFFFKNIFLVNALFNFIIIYFFNLFCIFCILFLILLENSIVFKKFQNIYGLSKINKILCFIVLILFLSLSSLPPFSGFFAKFYIFYFFVEYKFYTFYFILSFLNLFIIYAYVKSFKNIFSNKINFYIKNFSKNNKYLIYFITFITIFNIFFIFVFDFVYKFVFILLNLGIAF